MNRLSERISVEADAKVASWPKLRRRPGDYYKCGAAGFLVEVGEAFPVWREDMGAVRRLLMDLDIEIGELAQNSF